MLDFQAKLTSFQQKISTYDKANWKIIVEKYKSKTSRINLKNSKGVEYKRQLIDLDLFQGKKFSKAKPIYHWTYVTLKAALRIFLYPFYYKWWIEQLDYQAFFIFLFLYIIQLLIILIYSFNETARAQLSFIQTFSSMIIIFYVGQIYNHVISTNLTKPKHPLAPSKSDVKLPYTRSVSTDNVIISGEAEKSSNLQLRKRNVKKSKFLDVNYQGESDCGSFEHRGAKSFIPSPIEPHFDELTSDHTGSLATTDGVETIGAESADHISHSSSSLSESEEKSNTFEPVTGPTEANNKSAKSQKSYIQEEIVVTLFEEECVKKFKMSIWDIIQTINDRVNVCMLEYKYIWIIFILCIYFSTLPLLFEISRLCIDKYLASVKFHHADILRIICNWFSSTPSIVLLQMLFILTIRFFAIASLFFLLCVTERTFRLRYLCAKYFTALTSYRRARRNHLPHFRLYKVKNIKAWLSLRSYLRRNGPMRSIDVVVSSTFFISILLITVVCSQLLLSTSVTDISNSGFISRYVNWEIPSWAILFSSYLLRFMSLGAEVNRKYENNSELLTEQINLYLQMEITPHKKDEYAIANNVLKLASKLLKGIETPYNVTGFIMNPLLRNITRVVILSLISGVISEILGVKFKFWKIKA